MNIAIPKYFSLYNAGKQECKDKGWTLQGEYYSNLTKTFGKASLKAYVRSVCRL